jgi:sugar lactone lactonase YvrE
MRATLMLALALGLSGCATMRMGTPTVSILVDLDPASTDRTVIVENVIADQQGRLFLADWVSGNILRVDPKAPKPVVVGRIANRQIAGKPVRAEGRGIAFNRQGDLFVACDPFSEVVRLKRADINPEKPGLAETFATGTEGANGIAFDRQGNLYVAGARTGRIYRVGPAGGPAEVALQIERYSRTLPDGKTQQPIVANGVAFDAKGMLYVTDTARGAIWTVAIGADGKAGKPTVLVQSPLLEGADGLDFDGSGRLWVTANERNAIVTITPDGKVQEIAKNGSQGPLEFPSAIVFVGGTAYISNNDTPRRDNLDANGTTARDGIGASIAQITP